MNVYQIVTDKIVNQLKSGTIPWQQPWVSQKPVNWVTGRPYSGINAILLESGEYATFRQIKEAGGHVKKGAKAHQVVFWKILEVEGKSEEELSTKKVPLLRYYSVFKIGEQTEGLELRHTKAPRNRHEAIQKCEEVINGYVNKPLIVEGGRASYNPETDIVSIPKPEMFYSSEQYYATLFHELVHSTGHQTRLARPLTTQRSAGYSREELVAALGTAFLCAECGIINQTIVDNEAAYVQGWLSFLKNDQYALVWAASRAQKAVDYILRKESEEESESESELASINA
ncbi:MAG TPA: zincin-like metallopeptidase domain-containing protein [Candidatus Hydrothermia bacterium]|nr:zincin-like metallopeptidase domain-containing protein [Candidatus Hydrothermia bacterium]